MDNGRQYGRFAGVYDFFMGETPYEQWADYIESVLRHEGINDGLVLDLGCGTGKMTTILSDRGYDMIGIDSSAEMLGIAMEERGDRDILYLCQDMREFELYGTVRAVVSVCDCINYILSPEELVKVFSLVNNYLDPGGVFIFDINSEYKYRELLSDNTFAETGDEASFIWENCYDPERRLNEYALTFFEREEDGRYRRFEEYHYQRAYRGSEMYDIICRAGLGSPKYYGEYSLNPVRPDTERITFICREQGKEGKA